MKQHLCYVLNHNVLRRKMPIENQTRVELRSSICTAFNSHLQLNSYRLTQNKENSKCLWQVQLKEHAVKLVFTAKAAAVSME